jgi:hypothetical protein
MDMFFSLLVWNVRGLNLLARCDSIYQVVLLSGVSVVCFLETKLQVVSRANSTASFSSLLMVRVGAFS